MPLIRRGPGRLIRAKSDPTIAADTGKLTKTAARATSVIHDSVRLSADALNRTGSISSWLDDWLLEVPATGRECQAPGVIVAGIVPRENQDRACRSRPPPKPTSQHPRRGSQTGAALAVVAHLRHRGRCCCVAHGRRAPRGQRIPDHARRARTVPVGLRAAEALTTNREDAASLEQVSRLASGRAICEILSFGRVLGVERVPVGEGKGARVNASATPSRQRAMLSLRRSAA